MSDIKFAFRQLLKNPGFTTVAVLTLAICIGTNLTIFAVLDTILVRPLPFPEPDRLVVLHNAHPRSGIKRGKATITNYYERRGAIEAFEALGSIMEDSYIVGEPGSTRRVDVGKITPGFFETLGIPFAMGRAFTDDNLHYDSRGSVAILTNRFWQDHFNGNPDVIGKTFMMDSLSKRVIGVLPPEFRYLSSKAQVYLPNSHWPELRDPFSNFKPGDSMPDGRTPVGRHSARARRHDAQMVARLRPNQSIAEAQAQLNVLNAQLLSQDPLAETLTSTGYHTWIEPLREAYVHSAKPVVVLVQIGALLLLVLGSVNLAGLLVIRASGRRKELAVKQALGASHWQIGREILAETLILSLCGGLLGVCLAILGIRMALQLGASSLPLGAGIMFDGRTGVVAVLASVVVGIGIAIPIIAMHLFGNANVKLEGDVRGSTSSRGVQRLRHSLIIIQIALASVLLYAAGLLGMSLKHTLERSPGFEPDQAYTSEILLPWQNYREETVVPFVYRLLGRVREIPGVSHAAVSSAPPFTTQGSAPRAILAEDQTPSSNLRAHYLSLVSADYWDAMGIRLLQGRLLEDADSQEGAPRVAVIDQALAQQYWPNGDVLGKRFSEDPSAFDKERAFTVVGIVGNVKHRELSETETLGSAYLPYRSFPKFHLIVRAPSSVTTMGTTLQRAVHELDQGLPITDFKSMRMRIDDSLLTRKSPALLAVVFSGVALSLVAMGIYGVLAHAVLQRRREIGVRMAVGALRQQIGRQFLAIGLKILLVGTLLGVLGAWMVGRVMQNLLYGVPTFHVSTLIVTLFIIASVTLLCCLLPAVQAARLDPIKALNTD